MNTKLNKSDFYLLVTYFIVDLSFSANDYYERNALAREYYVDFITEVIVVCIMISMFVYWLIPKYVFRGVYLGSYFNLLITNMFVFHHSV